MPDVTFHRVECTAETTDPLEEILRQTPDHPSGPIMLVDIEKAFPSSLADHPVAAALNLRRPEWPQRLHRPVVFWVPQFVLGILSRLAPDFVDWRSDTLELPELTETGLMSLESATWTANVDPGLPEPARRERIAELRSRISGALGSTDPVVLGARSQWLQELATHLSLFGELPPTEQALREALDIDKSLNRKDGIGVIYNNLGNVHLTQGDSDEAERMFHRALEINEQLGSREGIAGGYVNLGNVHLTRGRLDEAERMFRKALEINEQLGIRKWIADAYGNLGNVRQLRGDLDEAERMHREALEIHEQLGHREGMANDCGNLGNVHLARGDLDEAERMYRKALGINEKLGRPEGMAIQHANLGLVLARRGEPGLARVSWVQARDLYARIGNQREVEKFQSRLDGLAKNDVKTPGPSPEND